MLAPGANVSEIARQHEISRQHLYLWRRAALAGELPLPACYQDRVRIPIAVSRSRGRTSGATELAIEVHVGGVVVRAPPGVAITRLTDLVQALKTLA